MSKKKEILYCYNENGICMYEYPEINGLKQYIQIRGIDRKNPLMLFLHGGPGGSMAGLCHAFQADWEKHFTVVNWDQRNTCKTFLANKKRAAEIAKTGSLQDYMADIDAVIKYLHTVYSFEKIVLAGFSWGSLIGAEYAKTHPENVSYYIGIGQHINYIEGLEYTCGCLQELAKDDSADSAAIAGFTKKISGGAEFTPEYLKNLQTFSILGAKYIAKDGKPFPVKELLLSPFLKFREKKAMLRSDPKMFEGTYNTLKTVDFRNNLRFEMPVLFVSGDEDFVCPNELLAQCFDKIDAPEKKNIVLEKATHTCFLDQPEAFIGAIVK